MQYVTAIVILSTISISCFIITLVVSTERLDRRIFNVWFLWLICCIWIYSFNNTEKRYDAPVEFKLVTHDNVQWALHDGCCINLTKDYGRIFQEPVCFQQYTKKTYYGIYPDRSWKLVTDEDRVFLDRIK